MAAAPAANCCSISAYARALPPRVLRHAAAIWRASASTASPTALSSSEISITICISGYPPSLGLLLSLRWHGSAPSSTPLRICSAPLCSPWPPRFYRSGLEPHPNPLPQHVHSRVGRQRTAPARITPL